MRFGINTFLFTSPFTNDSTNLFPQFKSWGFDSVEIAVEDPSHIDPSYVRSRLDEEGLVCGTLCGAFGPGRDLRGTPAEQETSRTYIRQLIDVMTTLGASTLVGPLYSAVGRSEFVTPDQRETQWQLVVDNLQEVCGYAESRGKKIAIEPLNRFETDFINTCEQGLRMVHEVDSPALGLLLDTFHMNIEEKDPAAAILQAGDKLAHFHACGTDRGTPGNDHTDWDDLAAALKRIGYSQDVVIESFTPDVVVIARAASIWREMEPNKNDIAIEGLRFLRQTLS